MIVHVIMSWTVDNKMIVRAKKFCVHLSDFDGIFLLENQKSS